MISTWTTVEDYCVEVWFRIQKDKDGYPKSKEWEQLLAHPLLEADDCFRLESIPFYLKNVSRGDVVRTKVARDPDVSDKEIFQFDSVLERGAHNTYRLLLRKQRPDDPSFTETELMKKGLAIEVKYGTLIAVDVPPSVDQQAIDAYLVTESRSGRWELQDGYLHTVKTT